MALARSRRCVFNRFWLTLVVRACVDGVGEQAMYCNDACVERFLRARGESVKKAAKHLRTVLSWRDTIGAGTFNNPSFHFSPLFPSIPTSLLIYSTPLFSMFLPTNLSFIKRVCLHPCDFPAAAGGPDFF
jgi:hypothetical protein